MLTELLENETLEKTPLFATCPGVIQALGDLGGAVEETAQMIVARMKLHNVPAHLALDEYGGLEVGGQHTKPGHLVLAVYWSKDGGLMCSETLRKMFNGRVAEELTAEVNRLALEWLATRPNQPQ